MSGPGHPPKRDNISISDPRHPPILGIFQTPKSRNVDSVPLPNEPSGLYSTLMTDTDLTASKKRFVKVSGTGETTVEPDSIEFVVQIIAIKTNLIDARASIKKREEYILAAIKKAYIQQTGVVCSEMVTKVNSENPDEDEMDVKFGQGPSKPQPNQEERYEPPAPKYFRICKEIHVHCDSLVKYLQIFSLCNEKLDQQVVVSQPIIKFSANLLQQFT
jgi:hypothetical protein